VGKRKERGEGREGEKRPVEARTRLYPLDLFAGQKGKKGGKRGRKG